MQTKILLQDSQMLVIVKLMPNGDCLCVDSFIPPYNLDLTPFASQNPSNFLTFSLQILLTGEKM